MKDMETLLKVHQTGSFSKTAELMHVTQPGVSKRIRNIERDLGCTLFERVGNQLLLTDSGRLAIMYFKEMTNLLETLKERISEQEEGMTNLTLALSNSLGSMSFSSRMKRLKSQFPTIKQLQLKLLSSGKVTESVLCGESDIGVRFFRDDNVNLIYEEIFRERLVVVTAADSVWISEKTLTIEHLSSIPWISLPSNGSGSVEMLSVFLINQLNTMGIYPQKTIEIDGFHSIKTMVASDFGAAILPLSHVQDDLDKGTLKAIPTQSETSIPINCVYRKKYKYSTMVNELISFLFQGD